MPGSSLLEQARRQAKGQSAERNDWNEITVGKKTFTMEYPFPSDNNKKNISSVEDLTVTSAFVKKENKVKCELCTMWFDRKSVVYQVPNHRILELRKKWNYHQTGRRYASASYLYGNSLVCCFCSQFLSTTEESTEHQEAQMFFSDLGSKSIQLYETPISRKNISLNCKTYQSSEVDSHRSINAIRPPYHVGAKTRREADPWYEVDLGKTIHVHSVSLSMKGPTQHNVDLHIFLLRGPVGFENPFLDSVKNIAVCHHVVQLQCSVIAKLEDVNYTFPPNSVGGAVRIQLEGLQTLHIFRFQAFQGDQIIPEPPPIIETENSADDLPYPDFIRDGDAQLRYDTFASYPPHTFKATKSKADTSKSRKKSKAGKMLTRVSDSVWKLHNQFETRKEFVGEWKKRSLTASKYFTFDELLAVRDLIFNPAVASTILSNNPTNSVSPPKSPMSILKKALHKIRPNSPSDLRSLAPVVRAQDLYTVALMETHPRCHVDALVKAINAVSLLCQGRDNGGEIGLLQNSPRFAFLAAPTDDFNIFDKLQLVIEFIKDTLRKHATSHDSLHPKVVNPELLDSFECSWSQFIIILWLLSTDRAEDIPPLAFNSYEDWDLMKTQLRTAEYAASLRPSSPSNKLGRTNTLAETGMPSTPIKSRPATGQSPDQLDTSTFDMTAVPFSRQNSASPGPRSPVMKKKSAPLSPSNSSVSETINSDEIRQIAKDLKGTGVSRGQTPKELNRPSRDGPPSSPGSIVLGASQSLSVFPQNFVREKSKHQTKSLLEKTQDERIAKLNLNFGHAQYKLDRIALRVDADILPRNLRTKLSTVTFEDLAPEALHLGVKQPAELFDTKGGHLSPHGIAPPSPIILPLQKQSPSARLLAKKFKRDIRTAPVIKHSTNRTPFGLALPVISKTTSVPISHQSSSSSIEIHTLPSSRSDSDPIQQNHHKEIEDEKISQRYHDEIDDHDKTEDYLKNCALCLHRFPVKSLQNKVLLKHIVSLRNIWDPSLVDKFMGDLLLGMSLFNLVPVCLFCSQYFNPDCENGISPPPVALPETKKTENKYGNKKDVLTEFYDSRYSGMKSAGDLLHDPRTIETRERAKRAIQISRELKRHQLNSND